VATDRRQSIGVGNELHLDLVGLEPAQHVLAIRVEQHAHALDPLLGPGRGGAGDSGGSPFLRGGGWGVRASFPVTNYAWPAMASHSGGLTRYAGKGARIRCIRLLDGCPAEQGHFVQVGRKRGVLLVGGSNLIMSAMLPKSRSLRRPGHPGIPVG
jgi:hypothetical protein